MSRPERVLLDTSVIIDLADVELGVHKSAEPAVSAVSVAELAFGLDVDDPIERRARAERYRTVRERFAGLAATPVLAGWTCRSPRRLQRTRYPS